MGQDWKTLAIVVVGAALAGWLMVRALGGGRHVETSAPPVAMASVPAPVATAARAAEAPVAGRTPARAPAALPPSVADVPADGDESVAIERDLGVLEGLLVRDQRIEDRVMPRINDVVDVPGVTSYRRAPDFWESAFDAQGMRR
jgi:hypothetical protein